MDVAGLNSLGSGEAALAFSQCCASTVWVDRMVAARPYRDTTAVLTTAEEVWWDLGAEAWQQAFAGHVATPAAPSHSEYEETFGHPYLVFVTDQSAEDLEVSYRRRLGNDLLSELRETAAEQARITNRALRQLLEVS
ncbi:MAG: 2-oxo-4-hydroxy-4-carboxy-5-ureidoimidazoline decarboxylase [Acidimicrobiia bacterium]